MNKTSIFYITQIFALLFLWCCHSKNKETYTIDVYNKSNKHVDSVSVKLYATSPDLIIKNETIKSGKRKSYEIDLSNYTPSGKDNFFFITVYQGDYYLSTTFNYHDNWGVTENESSIYIYDKFLSCVEMTDSNKNKFIQKDNRIFPTNEH